MKKILFLSFILMGLTSAPQQMLAQGLLGKVAKGIEKVNKGIDKATTKAQVATGKAQEQENGVVVMNPVSRVMAVEVVGAVGHSISENFGNVELVLRVNMKTPTNKILLGGSYGQGKTQAFDTDGNVYLMDMPSVPDDYAVTEGLPVKIVTSPFLKVRKSNSQLAVVKLVARIASEDASGELTFKNVPIEWDPVEE